VRSCSRCQSDSTWKRAGTRMARGGFGGGWLGLWGGALGAEEGFEEGEKVLPLSWVEDIFSVFSSHPRNLRVGKGGGR
jgi:hypothetical protein